MGLDLNDGYGQTALDEEEKEGLQIPTISTRNELDEFEQQNIEEALQWVMGRSFKPDTVFTEKLIRSVHKRMFGDVWAWAGYFRKTNKNIGIDSWLIQMHLKQLLEDARYWYESNTYPPDEMALRFKHHLVSIHCFSNGNGRHSRLMADIIIEKIYHQQVFSWGDTTLKGTSDARKEYLTALKDADHGDYSLLLTFARS